MQDKIFEVLFEKDDISWQTLIYELVKSEQMDPWDIDISLLAKKFFEMIKKLKEMDFRIPAKIILAAAILLRIKSSRLIGEDMSEFDRLISSSEQTQDEFYDELEQDFYGGVKDIIPALNPRVPQPRKRKVSVYDLIEALNKALEVKRRRVMRAIPPGPVVVIPEKKTDISFIINKVYKEIKDFFVSSKTNRMTFSQLIPSEKKEDKIFTFIPLLHLSNQQMVELFQQAHFGEIEIELKKPGVEKELAKVKNNEEPERVPGKVH